MQRYVPPSRRRADGEHGGLAETAEPRALEGVAPALSQVIEEGLRTDPVILECREQCFCCRQSLPPTAAATPPSPSGLPLPRAHFCRFYPLLHAMLQVRLVVLQEGVSFDPASCPLDIEAQPASSSSPEGGDGSGSASSPASAAGSEPSSKPAAPERCSTHLIFFPERLPVELLRWLADTFPSGAARLEFPPSLSKVERARWHKAADRARLHGESVGIGEGRYLTITTAASTSWGGEGPQQDEAGAASGARSRLTREQAERARFIWDCAQVISGRDLLPRGLEAG